MVCFFLIAAFACVGMGVFTACGDDDNPTPTPESLKFDKVEYEFIGTVNKSSRQTIWRI